MTLKGSVVLVTGGARRLGQAIARSLAQRQAHVVISYRTSARQARQTVRMLERLGPSALAIRADVSVPAQVRRLIDRIEARYGRLDVLVNCAATFQRTPFGTLSARQWDAALDANLKGPFLASWHASRLMRKHRRGKIINLADWAAVRPYRDYLPYCVSKAGVIGLTKALAKELAPSIHVNAIAPGPILPPRVMGRAERDRIARMVPLRRWGRPEDIANAVLFLIEGTDFMTGSVLFIDGGRLIA